MNLAQIILAVIIFALVVTFVVPWVEQGAADMMSQIELVMP